MLITILTADGTIFQAAAVRRGLTVLTDKSFQHVGGPAAVQLLSESQTNSGYQFESNFEGDKHKFWQDLKRSSGKSETLILINCCAGSEIPPKGT
jgi:hypothetical protein